MEINNAGFTGIQYDIAAEKRFVKRLENIVLKTLLYVEFCPDNVQPASPNMLTPKSLGFGKKTKSKTLTPMVIL